MTGTGFACATHGGLASSHDHLIRAGRGHDPARPARVTGQHARWPLITGNPGRRAHRGAGGLLVHAPGMSMTPPGRPGGPAYAGHRRHCGTEAAAPCRPAKAPARGEAAGGAVPGGRLGQADDLYRHRRYRILRARLFFAGRVLPARPVPAGLEAALADVNLMALPGGQERARPQYRLLLARVLGGGPDSSSRRGGCRMAGSLRLDLVAAVPAVPGMQGGTG